MGIQKENFSDWYNEIIIKAGLAEHSSTRGCIVLKPYGFALWEKIKRLLDDSFKMLGHQNAYFPLFIPLSYFSKEQQHVDGFAKECAVVTHYRLHSDGKGIVVDPTAALQEPLVVRPTSETIIWDHFSKWIQSYRDLPLLMNQWANVVRWEKRTRPFLRTLEFLWQEGHTAHASAEEAKSHTLKMLENYVAVFSKNLALPLIAGEKTEHEKFSGAVHTYTMEGMMQDGKALQLGTSHFLGQNFAKAFDVSFTNEKGQLDYVWGTSWGTTTRLIGALIMVHGDEKGLVLPPKIAPFQGVVIPIYHKSIENETVHAYALEVTKKLQDQNIDVKLDLRDTHNPGWKFNEYEAKGVPLRMSVGPYEIKNKTVEVVRRDTGVKEFVGLDNLVAYVEQTLCNMQCAMYEKALTFQQESLYYVDTFQEFKEVMQTKKGFIAAHWDGTTATELAIQEETKATIRCIPFDFPKEAGYCVYSGKPSTQRVLFAQAY